MNYAIRRLRKPASPTSPLSSRTAVIGSGAATVPVPNTTSPWVRPLNSIEKMPPVQVLSSASPSPSGPLLSQPSVLLPAVQEADSRPVKTPPVPENLINVEPKGPGDVPQEEKISKVWKSEAQL